MKKLNKKNYLPLRPFILSGQFNEGVIDFMQKWCEETKRPFDTLMFILDKANTFGFVGDLLGKLIRHLDVRFEVTKLIHIKTNTVIKVY